MFFLLHREAEKPLPLIPEDLLPILIYDELERLFSSGQEKHTIDRTRLYSLCAQAKSLKMVLNDKTTREKSQDYLAREMKRLASNPETISIKNVIGFLNLAEDLNLKPDLWECQNLFYELYNNPDFTRGLETDISAVFHELGRRLGFLDSRSPIGVEDKLRGNDKNR